MDARFLTIADASKKLADGSLTSEALVAATLSNIEKHDADVHSFVGVYGDAMEQAKEADRRRAAGEDAGPLCGVPVAMKDNILVLDQKASAGSKILSSYTAAYDATVTARLKKAGAVLVGRTNMDEFAMGSSSESSAHGPTKNPWDLSRVPGGSSGGSAAAVAAGLVPAALGSDTGGSVRQPAALCGVTGLKPTYGRVSRYGLIAMASSLDQIGPLTRTVEDAATVLRAIEGEDPKDATTVKLSSAFVPELETRGVKGLRVGLPKEYFADGLDPFVKKAVEEAVKVLEAGGASVREVSLPHSEYALAAYYVNMPAEASSNLGRFDGLRYGAPAAADELRELYMKTRGEGFGAEVKRRIVLGSYVLSAGYYDAYYRKAMQVRTLIKRDFEEAFKDVDVIAGPTSPSVAWKLGEKFGGDPLTMYLSDIYTISANLAGVPALSVPCGFVDGLPIGFQLHARHFGEADLFRAGMYYQDKTDWHKQTPA